MMFESGVQFFYLLHVTLACFLYLISK